MKQHLFILLTLSKFLSSLSYKYLEWCQVQHSVVDMRPQQRMAELCQLTGVKLITSLVFSLTFLYYSNNLNIRILRFFCGADMGL